MLKKVTESIDDLRNKELEKNLLFKNLSAMRFCKKPLNHIFTILKIFKIKKFIVFYQGIKNNYKENLIIFY